MPVYEYRCKSCGKVFTLQLSISEHEKGKITCPDCKGSKVVQQYSTFFAKTSKKS
ncbi:MAG: zinc ribbon domain-containing protein [Desulfuromonadaceae bacterium]|nr:zinc ribbon domain-containing protein [Desulfuromonadaceae bacterium]